MNIFVVDSCPIKAGNMLCDKHTINMLDKYKCNDAVIAYRSYYNNEKAKFAKWKCGNIPEWFIRTLPNEVHM